jgi:hypothetical protein
MCAKPCATHAHTWSVLLVPYLDIERDEDGEHLVIIYTDSRHRNRWAFLDEEQPNDAKHYDHANIKSEEKMSEFGAFDTFSR